MLIEAILLSAILLALHYAGLTNPVLLFLFAVVLALCTPVFKLAFQAAPPFVPTPKKTVKDMADLACIKSGETVYDLGCGDGRLLIAAADKGATAVGYELSFPTYILAKLRTYKHENVTVHCRDFWKKEYGDADVIFCYLLIRKMGPFKEQIWPQLKPGTRVVSHSFKLPGVEPTATKGDAVLYVK